MASNRAFIPPAQLRGKHDIRGPAERMIRQIHQAINEVRRDLLTELADRLDTLETTKDVVHARILTTTLSAMTITEQTKLTATLAIPADWNTYDVEVMGTLEWLDGGAVGSALLTVRTKLAGSSIGVSSIQELSPTADTDDGTVAFMGWVAGATATGNRDCTVTTQLSAETGQYDVDNIQFICHAWRTS